MKEKRKKISTSAWLAASALLTFLVGACTDPKVSNDDPESLPFFGEFDIEINTSENGATQADTTYYPIPKFSFVNQDSLEITQKNYEGFITLVDFFFTDCPSICPVMSAQMARLQTKMMNEHPDLPVRYLSFSVKPETDTPSKLKAYAEKIGADLSCWNFLTGKPEDIYSLAQDGFLLTAFPSDTAAGGIFHTDKVTLLDKQLRMRGYYDGTSTLSMDQLFNDAILLSKQK